MQTNTAHLTIRTPEGIIFTQPLGGPIMRFVAVTLDEVIILTLIGMVSSLIGTLGAIAPGLTYFLQLVFAFLLQFGYAIVLEWLWNGQTVGKRLVGLRVIDEGGLKLRFTQIVLRNLIRVVDFLPVMYFVGGVACLFSARRQRLGDVAANTVVVRTDEVPLPDIDQVMAGKYNSFRDHAHICARLRLNTPPELAHIALQALTRRDQLDDDARLTLFTELAEALREAATFPDIATFGLTDEQYVRNAVDVLFRAEPKNDPEDRPAGRTERTAGGAAKR